jgi:hypothetical protein
MERSPPDPRPRDSGDAPGPDSTTTAHPTRDRSDRTERRTLWLGGICLFAIGWASVSVTNAAETLFLKRVGVEKLPLVFLINSLLLVATTYLLGRWASTARLGRSLVLTLLGSCCFLIALWLALQADLPGALSVLVISAKQIQALTLLVFWIAMGGWLDGRQAKRLVPPMLAGGTLGAAFGSFASPEVGAWFGIRSLIPVAALALGGATLGAWALDRTANRRIDWPTRKAPAAPRPSTAELWRSNGLFRILAVTTLLAGMLAPILYYLFSAAADAATAGIGGEQELLDLYGTLRGWINVAILLLQLGGTAFLFAKVGVPRAALLAPLVFSTGLLGFAFLGGLGIAVAAMVAATLQDKALSEPAEKTLATLFPESDRPAAVAALDGVLKRAGGAAGNVLVLATVALSFESLLPFFALLPAGLWLTAALALVRVYPSVLLQTATRRRTARGGDPMVDPTLLDDSTIRALRTSLQDETPGRSAAACALAIEAPPGVAAPIVAEALLAGPISNLAGLTEAWTSLLEAEAPPSPAVLSSGRFLREAGLQRADLPTGLRAQLLIVSIAAPPSVDASGALDALRNEPDTTPALRFAADLVTADRPGIVDIIRKASQNPEPEIARLAVLALRTFLISFPSGDSSQERALGCLTDCMQRPELGTEAAATLAVVARHRGQEALVVLRSGNYLDDFRAPEFRAALLRAHAWADPEAAVPAAIRGLDSGHAGEVHAAQEVLRRGGRVALEASLNALHTGGRRTRLGLLPVLRDRPLDRPSIEDLIEGEISNAERIRDILHGLEETAGASLLRQRLRERIGEAGTVALSLLSLLEDDERIGRLGALVGRLRQERERERAIALEALESILRGGRGIALLRILEERSEAPRQGATEEADALQRALRETDLLTRAFALAVLAEKPAAGANGKADPLPADPALIALLHPRSGNADSADPRREKDSMLSGIDIMLHLRSLGLFERLSTPDLTEIAGIVREVQKPAGTTLVREGEIGDCMYLIVSGAVEVRRSDVLLSELGPRDFFGEMSMIDGETRSASVVTRTRVQLLRIDRLDLQQAMEERPGIAIGICEVLTQRLRRLNEKIQNEERAPAAPDTVEARASASGGREGA